MTTPTRRRYIPGDIQDAIEALADEGYSPKQIEGRLKDQKVAPRPTIRTIQRIVSARAHADESGAWEIDAATEVNPSAAFKVLAEVVTHTEGRVSQLSRLEARWVTTLTALRGELPAWEVYRLAHAYILRRQARQTTEDLDAFLAFAPWLESQVQGYVDAILDGRVPSPPIFLQDLIADSAGFKVLADWLDGEPRRFNLRKFILGLPDDMPIKQWFAQREETQDDSQR